MRSIAVIDRRRAAGAGLALAVTLTLAAAGCGGEPEPDAYGTFEATEVVVSAQTSGQLQRFTPVEGMRLGAGQVVALIDTTPLALERAQIVAQRAATGSRGGEVAEQLRVLEVQHEIARRTYERTQRLHAEQVVDHPIVLGVGQPRHLRRHGDAARLAEADAAAGRAGDHRGGSAVAGGDGVAAAAAAGGDGVAGAAGAAALRRTARAGVDASDCPRAAAGERSCEEDH